jgi:hypothetical protein
MENREFYSAREFAEKTGMRYDAVCYHIREGNVLAAKIGKIYRIPRSVLERMALGGNAADSKPTDQ